MRQPRRPGIRWTGIGIVCAVVFLCASCADERSPRGTSPPGSVETVVSPVETGPTFSFSSLPEATATPWASPPVTRGIWGIVVGNPRCPTLTGCDLAGGPLAGQVVKLYDEQGELLKSAVTDSLGQYKFATQAGDFTLAVEAKDLPTARNIVCGDVKATVSAGGVPSYAAIFCEFD